MTIEPFRVDIPQQKLDRIMRRLRDAEWPDEPAGEPWSFGTDPAMMRDLVDHWLHHFDWRAVEASINRFPQFKARIDGYDIHFLHVHGSGRNPQPLLLSHGWPGSFAEFLKVIGPLAHPERYGGDADDGFSVVVPSLPGFGFSSKPASPINSRLIAGLFDRLMTEILGYEGYIAQGGDYGYAISHWIGRESTSCKAVHLNFLLGVGAPAETEEEAAAMLQWQHIYQTEGAYIAIQTTKPLTLSYAMADSPLGVAAWIFEKFHGWSDLKNGNPWSTFSKDEILTNIMIYLVTGTFGTASWMYRGEPEVGPPTGRVEKPTGVARFPGERAFWPRSYAERAYNLVRWSDLPAGGHFAAMEQPGLFVDELRAFRRQLATA